MVNKVFLVGRLTKDPEIRFLPSGSQVTSFTLAVNRAYKTKDRDEWKEETYFFDVEAFGQLANRTGKLSKGIQIVIEGHLRQDRWETASGEKRSKIKIVAEKVNILSKPKNKDNPQDKSLNTDIPEEVPF